MDYKEKVIELLKSKELNKEEKEKLANIFPELKESEDDRIRKEIIAFLTYYHTGQGNSVKYDDDWIAWLEKQGKNNMGISEATKKKLEDNLNKALEKETPESYNEFLEKQGEQKLELLTKEKALKNSPFVEQKPAWSEEGTKGNNGEIPNSTWSDEDEINLEKAIWYVENPTPMVVKDSMLVEWLKSLKDKCLPQPKQEWSEEDEKKLNLALYFLNESKQNAPEEFETYGKLLSKKDYEDVVNWLKSLRPQNAWKPSNEQMEALANALSLAKNCGDESAFDLRTLYEQLKALHRYEQDT